MNTPNLRKKLELFIVCSETY